jgi:hypothetical protein
VTISPALKGWERHASVGASTRMSTMPALKAIPARVPAWK